MAFATQKQIDARKRNHSIRRLRGIPVGLFEPDDQPLIEAAIDRALVARGAKTQAEHMKAWEESLGAF